LIYTQISFSYANSNGGGGFINSYNNLTLLYSNITDNKCELNGGGLYLLNNNNILYSNVYFQSNIVN
jgi:hypothetical protein